MKKLKENKPAADVLMNSIRSIGYSFESSVADIIDNSISANAKIVQIYFPINPLDIYVAICDDGTGMTSVELFDAMKYGSENKKEFRPGNDLGRYGLGLKSASLSQCRKLTVMSKKNNEISAYSWDLDVVNEKHGWYMIEYDKKQVNQLKCIDWFDDKQSGTVVLWENFDLIEKTTGGVYSELKSLQEITSNYLSLIFHRFLNRLPTDKIIIKINNFELKGLDPFLENNKKTTPRKKVEISVEDSRGIERMVTVEPFVLPFQKDLSDEDKKLSGGIENYRSRQGFYIYRNERLIIWGKWFGRNKDELTKYARVRVDIPNTLDDIWSLDIKKQNAVIPKFIQNRLNRAVDDVMDTAVKVQKYRGRKVNLDETIEYVWNRIKGRENQYTYKINRESKIFDLIKNKMDDETWENFDMILEEIEMNIPFQQIYIDKSQNNIQENYDNERIADIEAKAKALLAAIYKTGNKNKLDALDKIFKTEPFNQHIDIKEKILKEIQQDEH